MKVIDFVWILFYFTKALVKKIFFIRKKNPDLYIADHQGFFYNQGGIGYVPLKVLWDVYKISRIFKLIAQDNFVSLYLRGGIAVGDFNKKISDLDLIVFVKKPQKIQPILLYVSEALTNIFPQYSKVDVLYLDINDYKSDKINKKTKTILSIQPLYIFGKKICLESKLKFNDNDLWSFFSSSLSEQEQKQYFLTKLSSIQNISLKSEKVIVQQIAKSVIRGLFEQLNLNKRVYTKNVLHIKKIIENDEFKNEKKQDVLNLIYFFEKFISNNKHDEEFKKLLLKTLNYF